MFLLFVRCDMITFTHVLKTSGVQLSANVRMVCRAIKVVGRAIGPNNMFSTSVVAGTDRSTQTDSLMYDTHMTHVKDSWCKIQR